MAEKTFNTRVQLKYDSYENWEKSSVVLRAGEIAIAHLGPTNDGSTHASGQHPVLMKVGNGKLAFKDLPWMSALAADVYEWAKCSHVELDGQVLKFHNNNKSNPVHTVDLSTFVTGTELTAILNNYITKGEVGVTSLEASGDSEVTLAVDKSTGDVKLTGAHALHAAGNAKTASTATISGHSATGTIKIPKLVTNAAGHVTEIDEETVTIQMPAPQEFIDTNTAHSHVAGRGTTVDGSGGINGEVKVNLNIAMDLINSDIVIYDADDNKKTAIASMSAADFIKDGMIESVELVDRKENETTATGQYLKITWNIDNANGTDTDEEKDVVYLDVTKLVDVYTGGSNADITVAVSDANVITATLNKQFALASALDNYKTKQDAYSNNGSKVKTLTAISQNANGEITATFDDITFPAPVDITGKKDIQDAVDNKITDKAHVLSSLAQNANGDISYQVKQLTPADIGTLTADEIANQDVAILQAAQEYADSLPHEDTKYTAAANGGLKLNQDNSFAIDDSITFVFYCGTSTELVDNGNTVIVLDEAILDEHILG